MRQRQYFTLINFESFEGSDVREKRSDPMEAEIGVNWFTTGSAQCQF